MKDPQILSIIFKENIEPMDKALEKALTYVGPVAYHIGWNINTTIEALNYFTQAEIPLNKSGTSLRHILLKLTSLEDEFNPMIYTFPEILEELSKLSKNEIDSIFGRSGNNVWDVLKVYQSQTPGTN